MHPLLNRNVWFETIVVSEKSDKTMGLGVLLVISYKHDRKVAYSTSSNCKQTP